LPEFAGGKKLDRKTEANSNLILVTETDGIKKSRFLLVLASENSRRFAGSPLEHSQNDF